MLADAVGFFFRVRGQTGQTYQSFNSVVSVAVVFFTKKARFWRGRVTLAEESAQSCQRIWSRLSRCVVSCPVGCTPWCGERVCPPPT